MTETKCPLGETKCPEGIEGTVNHGTDKRLVPSIRHGRLRGFLYERPIPLRMRAVGRDKVPVGRV